MPMLPSLAAATVYGALKIAGYSAYAAALGRHADSKVRSAVFGLAKTVLGLAAGTLLFFALVAANPQAGDLVTWLGALPLRFMVWLLALHLFFSFDRNRRALFIAAAVGTVISYSLDGVMWLLYRILPGMQMPWC